jgi:hypothetical protein
MLRAVENVSHVAELLSSAMANATGGASNVSTAVGDEGRDRQIETSGQLIGAS